MPPSLHPPLPLSQTRDGRPSKQHTCDVRYIGQGLVLGIEKEAAAGEVFNLAGAALFDWGEAVNYLAGRYGLGTVEARLPYPNYFELEVIGVGESGLHRAEPVASGEVVHGLAPVEQGRARQVEHLAGGGFLLDAEDQALADVPDVAGVLFGGTAITGLGEREGGV